MSASNEKKYLSEGLCFVVRAGLIYKTKTPLISHHLVPEARRSTGLTVSGFIGLQEKLVFVFGSSIFGSSFLGFGS